MIDGNLKLSLNECVHPVTAKHVADAAYCSNVFIILTDVFISLSDRKQMHETIQALGLLEVLCSRLSFVSSIGQNLENGITFTSPPPMPPSPLQLSLLPLSSLYIY